VYNDVQEDFIMGIFRRKKSKSLSELQGVPDGTFRCDVCRFVWPKICLCGSVVDAADDPPKVYVLCSICAVWLGFGEYRFPQGLCFNFTEEQRERINTFQKELDICSKGLGQIVEGELDLAHDFLGQIPNLREFLRLRSSLFPQNLIDLSGKLTRGEFVARSEIEKVNKG
jgi:hypothetical protein